MDVTTDSHRAFLERKQSITWPHSVHRDSLLLAAHSILLVEPLEPGRKGISFDVLHARFLIDRTLSQSLETSFSASCLQFIRFSIQPSSVGIDPGSVVGDSLCGSGIFPTSISILESITIYLRAQYEKDERVALLLVGVSRRECSCAHKASTLVVNICGNRLRLRWLWFCRVSTKTDR